MSPQRPPLPPWIERLGALAPVLLAAALLALSLLRAVKVEAIFGPNADCGGCMGRSSFGHDAWLLVLGFALLAASQATVHRLLRRIAMLVALALTLLVAADLAILSLLNARLYLLDVFKFGGEWRATADFLRALWRAHPVLVPALALGLAATIACCLIPAPPRPRQSLGFAVTAALCLALAIPLSGASPTHVNSDSFVNLWQLHRDQGVARAYSEAFAADLAARHRPPTRSCEPGQARRPDVIVVLWESLSAYHSALGTAQESVVSEFDAIARRNTWFSAFHANGFTTDHGLIALLTGEYPVPQVGRYSSLKAFAGFENAEAALPEQLRRHGYWSGFFTTGDLGFLDKPAWLKALRFDHWEGQEAAFYAGMPRGPFSAAEDAALYGRMRQWMQQREAGTPFLAVLLTVESHPPFINRGSGAIDEAQTFRDADRAFGDFYRALEASGFLQRGILVVLGDHRSMTPLREGEASRYGGSALARTPMLVAGASGLPQGEIALPFQQTDLLPSLLQLTADGQACHRNDQGRFLRPDPRPPAFIVHARGDQRSRIDVYTARGDGALLLDGDASTWLGDAPPEQAWIADFLHSERIRRGRLESDIPAILRMMGRD